jgi:hypothetical protein
MGRYRFNVIFFGVVLGLSCFETSYSAPAIFSVGSDSVCVKGSDGFLKCAGNNKDNVLARLGATGTSSPFARADFGKVSGLEGNGSVLKVVQSDDDDLHLFCAIIGTSPNAVSGGIKCWGRSYSQLLGPSIPTMSVATSAVAIATLQSGVTDVSIGASNICAVKGNQVYCWGRFQGLTVAGSEAPYSAQPVLVPNVTDAQYPFAISVSVGRDFACAIVANSASAVLGALKCWGDLDYIPGYQAPAILNNLTSGVSAVSLGQSGLLIHNGIGKKFNYGGNVLSPTFPVSGLPAGVSQVASGSEHECAIAGGVPYCWGSGKWGALGQGTYSDSSSPTIFMSGQVEGISISGNKTCVMVSGNLRCSGKNRAGELRSSGQVWAVTSPQTVTTDPVPIGMDAGVWASYIVKGGKYGIFGASDSSSPVFPAEIIPGVANVGISRVASFREFDDDSSTRDKNNVCVIKNSSTGSALFCKGNPYIAGASAGGGTPPGSHYENFAAIQGLTDSINPYIIGLSVSRRGVCAIVSSSLTHSSGNLKCWGQGFDVPLPSGYHQVPQVIDSGSQYLAVALSNAFGCGIRSNNAVVCWGNNNFGQIGQGPASSNPVQLMDSTNSQVFAKSIAVSPNANRPYACALLLSGAVRCWGMGYGSSPSVVNFQPGGLFRLELSGGMNSLGKGEVYGVTPEAAYLPDSSLPVSGFNVNLRAFTAHQSFYGGPTHMCGVFKGPGSLGNTYTYTLRCQGENYNGSAGGARNFKFSAPVTVSGY